MHITYFKRMILCLLAAALTGCAEVPARPETVPAATAAAETVATEPGPRYQVAWAADAVIYEVNVRQYTREGTFAAFSKHLPVLKDMGINTLWFMPIHPISQTRRSGTLGSYYSVTDYRAVNPEFGTAEDFKALVEEAHAMGFTVMLDWVANHTGWDCPWIREHPDWYTRDENGNITDPVGMGWPDVADLDYSNQEMRAEMIACMKYWVEEFDIDGFRCDYASGVPQGFWENARAELETVKPMLMLAEDNTLPSLLRYAFDMNYNWELYDTLRAIATDRKTGYYIRNHIPRDYPDGSYRLNFLNNHDKNSWEYTIMEAFGPEALPSMWALIYTLPGTPLVYTGDEIGLDHKIAFMEKDPIDWESGTRDYRPLLKELSEIRSENTALHSGNYGGDIIFAELGNRNVLAFTRQVEGNRVVCLFNLSKRETEVDLTGLFAEGQTLLLHGQADQLLEMEDIPVTLEGTVTLRPWEFRIAADKG